MLADAQMGCFPGVPQPHSSVMCLIGRMILFILEYAVRYLLVPGRVENWVLLVDLTGCGLSMAASSTFRSFA